MVRSVCQIAPASVPLPIILSQLSKPRVGYYQIDATLAFSKVQRIHYPNSTHFRSGLEVGG
jgi:hypothetical protein